MPKENHLNNIVTNSVDTESAKENHLNNIVTNS